MALYKLLKGLKTALIEIENRQPGNWLGHWSKSIQIKSLKSRIAEIENKLNKNKNK